MRVLAVNCGSSSLKAALYEAGTDGPGDPVLSANLARIGRESELRVRAGPGAGSAQRVDAPDHAAGAKLVLDWLAEHDAGRPDVVAHRVVHGGVRFRAPVRLDAETIDAIEAAGRLAPLHNAPALAAIRAMRGSLGEEVVQTASFDTAFHAAMPERAARYAIPLDLADRHGLLRFGFHGLAHRSMAERAAEMLGRPLESLRLVTLQLGAGCSAAAVDGGRSIDTTMGLTPLEGLVMATRSGDVDPTLPRHLAEAEGISVEEAEDLLNERSGLLGVSGRASDVRELTAAADAGDERSALALEMYVYRARKQVGAYLAALGGADAIVFGGGVGEHHPRIRAGVCEGLEWAGIALDADANDAATGGDAVVSRADAGVAALVVAVDEERLIARDALECLRADAGA